MKNLDSFFNEVYEKEDVKKKFNRNRKSKSRCRNGQKNGKRLEKLN